MERRIRRISGLETSEIGQIRVMKIKIEKGFSLVETLVAICLLSLGSVAALALHYQSQRILNQAEWISMTDNIVLSLQEINNVREANHESLIKKKSNQDFNKNINLDSWKQTLEQRFPGSTIAMNCNNNHCSFIITPPKTLISLQTITVSFQ